MAFHLSSGEASPWVPPLDILEPGRLVSQAPSPSMESERKTYGVFGGFSVVFLELSVCGQCRRIRME